ncbi:MAG TPA: spore germination protein [Clostridiales bacterium]|nr:spore germination protein [Clostridiales bacterium]
MPRLWLKKIKAALCPAPNLVKRTFSLGRRRPFRTHTPEEADRGPPKTRADQPAGPPGRITGEELEQERIGNRLDANLQRFRGLFNVPRSSDVVVREFRIGSSPAIRAGMIFIDGLVARDQLTGTVLQPLMLLSKLGRPLPRRGRLKVVAEKLLPHHQLRQHEVLADLVDAILAGNTVLLIDGVAQGLVVEARGHAHRAVEQTTSETVVRGPKHSFTENLRVNTALVRRLIRCPSLVIESWTLGRLTRTEVVLMYIEGLTNPWLVEETRRRISTVDVDRLLDAGMLERMIESPSQPTPFPVVPTMLATERPDRTAAFLADGYLAILVGDSPHALIAPTTFQSFLHNPEDYYLNWPLGTALRLVRLIGTFTSLLLPAAYLSLINYHHALIPTELVLAIAAARERVPFPSLVEIIGLEVGFELIREAGIRIPSVIGPTIGIVGAVILGQAAVAANLASPLLVIIVALTALGSFAIPNYSAAMLLRTYRFFFIALAAIAGFFGIAVGIYLIALMLCATKSFGVPFLSPVAPFRGGSPDVVLHGAQFLLHQRPRFLRPLDLVAQRRLIRSWDPVTAQLEEESGRPEHRPPCSTK